MGNTAIVVGSGIVGSVIARYLAEAKNMKVVIWERRSHIAGNMYDYVDEHGIRVHQYGPHIFHTNKKEVYDYICKYGDWEPYKLVCGAVIDGVCTPTAFNFRTIDLFYSSDYAETLKKRIREYFGLRESATVVEMLDCKDPLIREYAQFLFDKDYSLYTAKQWGVQPSDIDKSVLKRVPIRFSYEEAYFSDKYQLMPKNGYAEFVGNILNHPNIMVELNTDALKNIRIVDGERIYVKGVFADYPIIYTGAIDALFNFSNGQLPYRSLKFEWKYENKDSFQELPVIAYPQAEGFTRITEYKKLPLQNVQGTSYAFEYPLPYNPDSKNIEPYYPVLTEESRKIYLEYQDKISKIQNLYCCGRLADFKYYNMDDAIANALQFLKIHFS